MSTADATSTSAVSRGFCASVHGHVLSFPEAPSDLRAALATRRIASRIDSEFAAQLRVAAESLLGDDLSPATPNAGLVPALLAAARRLGYEVQVRDDLRIARLAQSNGSSPADVVHVADYVAAHPRCVVRTGKGVKSFEVVALLARANPGARIVVLAETRSQAAKLLNFLSQTFPRGYVRRGVPAGDEGAWLAISLPQQAADGDFARSHLVIVLEAAAVAHQRVRLALSASDGHFRIVAIHRTAHRLSPLESDRLFAACGPFVVELPAPATVRAVCSVAWMRHAHDRSAAEGDVSAISRRLVDRNHVRNARIAKLAESLASGSAELRRLCPDAARWVREGGLPSGALLLTDTLEQAACLLRRLPSEWGAIVGPDGSGEFETGGLAPRDRTLLECRRSLYAAFRVATTSAIQSRRLRLHQVDAIIWAGAGPAPPPIPRELVLRPAGTAGRVLAVDVEDFRHRRLRRWSLLRASAYLREDFFLVGETPEEGRVRRFLAERPRRRGDGA